MSMFTIERRNVLASSQYHLITLTVTVSQYQAKKYLPDLHYLFFQLIIFGDAVVRALAFHL